MSCRTIQVPELNGDCIPHQRMLDYVIRDSSLSDWVIIQHADLFWKTQGWLDKILDAISATNQTALPCITYTKYFVQTQQVLLVGDFFGVFNRRKLVSSKFSFCSKTITPSKTSRYLNKLIQSQKVNLNYGEWLDGSILMSVELAARNEVYRGLEILHDFVHLMAFYHIHHSFGVQDDILMSWIPLDNFGGVDKAAWVRSFAIYAYLSTYVFDASETGHYLPWDVMERICIRNNVDVKEIESLCVWISGYGPVPTRLHTERYRKIGFAKEFYQEDLSLL